MAPENKLDIVDSADVNMSGCHKATLLTEVVGMIKKKAKGANYMAKVAVQDEKGIIDYDPDKMQDIVGGENLSYDEYIIIQERSKGKVRGSFQLCYYEIALGFKGQVEKQTRDKICFKRIYVDGMYPDGICFEGKEDHAWMDLKGFERFQQGDSVSFGAEVYRYLKTGNGKIIDFGLRNPRDIQAIEPYELPSDEDLLRQTLDLVACDTCFLSGTCSGTCFLPKGQRKAKVNDMFKFLQAAENDKGGK